MTVANQTYKVQADGNGVATVFSFSPMVIFDPDDLQVTITDNTGVDTELTRGVGATNYSVAVTTYPGTGSITYPATGATRLQSDESVTIKRLLIQEQLTDLENQGGYFPDVQETAFDRLTMITLQQQEELDRVLKVPVSDVAANLTIPTVATRAGKVLAFDAAGLPIASEGVASIPISAFVATIVDDTSAAAVRTTIGLGALSVLDTVTLTELEDGTQGDILYYGAAGAPARLGTGTVGQVLQAGGAGANPSWTTLAAAGLPRSYLAGLGLSNGTDTTNDIDIAIGTARDADDSADLTLASAVGKQLDVTWASGGTPGAPTGGLSSSLSITNTTYHVHLILVSGTVEVGFDTSVTAANLVADHSATAYRRIGSILRESAAIVPFVQTGDEFRRTTTATVVSATNPGTAAVSRTLAVPVGIIVAALMNLGVANAATTTNVVLLVSDLALTDETPSTTASPLGQVMARQANTTQFSSASIRTNTSAQVRTRLNASGADVTIYLSANGWIDTRGRIA